MSSRAGGCILARGGCWSACRACLTEWCSWKQHLCWHDLELAFDLLHMFIGALLGYPEDILSRSVYEVLVCALLCRFSIEFVHL